jgi:hypothetical protein
MRGKRRHWIFTSGVCDPAIRLAASKEDARVNLGHDDARG